MHYNWQIVVIAEDAEDAISEAESVLEGIGGEGHVWDWYSIGGRWDMPVNAICATDKEFWKRLKGAEKSQRNHLAGLRRALLGELKKEEITLEYYMLLEPLKRADYRMLGAYVAWIADLKHGHYTSESYLATGPNVWGSPEVPAQVRCQIWDNPNKYWIVNVDIHN